MFDSMHVLSHKIITDMTKAAAVTTSGQVEFTIMFTIWFAVQTPHLHFLLIHCFPIPICILSPHKSTVWLLKLNEGNRLFTSIAFSEQTDHKRPGPYDRRQQGCLSECVSWRWTRFK